MEDHIISPYLKVKLMDFRGHRPPVLMHNGSGTVLKIWSVIEGLEEAAWYAMIAYAERVAKLDCVHWETDDIDFLFPCAHFVGRYMDPVGDGTMTVEEVAVEIMKRRIGDADV